MKKTWAEALAKTEETRDGDATKVSALANTGWGTQLFGAALASYQGKIAACKQDYVCVNGLDNQLSQSFEIFSGGITGSHIPAALSAESLALNAASSNVVADLGELAGAQSEAQFQSAEATSLSPL